MAEVSLLRSAVSILECIMTVDGSKLSRDEGRWLSRIPLRPIFQDMSQAEKRSEYEMALMSVTHPEFTKQKIISTYANAVPVQHRFEIFSLAVEAAVMRERGGTANSIALNQTVEELRRQWGISESESARMGHEAFDRAQKFKSDPAKNKSGVRPSMLLMAGGIFILGLALWYLLARS